EVAVEDLAGARQPLRAGANRGFGQIDGDGCDVGHERFILFRNMVGTACAPDTGLNRLAADVSAWSSSSVNSRSAASTFFSNWATLLAPGMATTLGRRITHASATCAGVASCDLATSRKVSNNSWARAMFSG